MSFSPVDCILFVLVFLKTFCNWLLFNSIELLSTYCILFVGSIGLHFGFYYNGYKLKKDLKI